MLKKIKRWLYVRAMMRAIAEARNGIYISKPPRTYGLRVIKTFEDVNGIKFDPFDDSHVDRIRGMANYEWFFRSVKLSKPNAKHRVMV